MKDREGRRRKPKGRGDNVCGATNTSDWPSLRDKILCPWDREKVSALLSGPHASEAADRVMAIHKCKQPWRDVLWAHRLATWHAARILADEFIPGLYWKAGLALTLFPILLDQAPAQVAAAAGIPETDYKAAMRGEILLQQDAANRVLDYVLEQSGLAKMNVNGQIGNPQPAAQIPQADSPARIVPVDDSLYTLDPT